MESTEQEDIINLDLDFASGVTPASTIQRPGEGAAIANSRIKRAVRAYRTGNRSGVNLLTASPHQRNATLKKRGKEGNLCIR